MEQALFILIESELVIMSWKEFLKPDWKKIVISIITLHFLVGFVSFIYLSFASLITDVTFVEGPLWLLKFFLLGTGWLLVGGLFSLFPIFGLIFMIVIILVAYAFSCLLIWIYNKVKKK